MNFLQLCNRVIREGDVSGGALSAVTGNSGERNDVIEWVKSAYEDICEEQDEWKFLRSSFSLSTVADTQAYAPSSATDSRLGGSPALDGTTTRFHYWHLDSLRIYLQSAGVATQREFPFMDYDWFRDQWMIRTHTSQFPNAWSIRPDDDAILLGPTPNAVYVVTGDYQRRAPALSATTDEPLFESEFHMAIVWRAVKYLATKRGDSGQYVAAEREYNRIYGRLAKKHLPEIKSAGPIA